MSILDNNFYESPQRLAAKELLHVTKITFDQMVFAFNHGSEIFWQNNAGASPQEISDELGQIAKEVFQLHAKLGNLISSVKPESIQNGLSMVGNFIMNEDGTVTILSSDTVSE